MQDAVRILIQNDDYLPYYSEMTAFAPQVVVTFDFAGFHLVDEDGEVIYNPLYCACYHILTKAPWFYPDQLLKRMNFTAMAVTMYKEDAEYIRYFYSNVPGTAYLEHLTGQPLECQFLLEGQAVVVSNYENPEEIKDRLAWLPYGFSVIAKMILEKYPFEKYLPLQVAQCLEELKCTCSDEEFMETMVLLQDLDHYQRMKVILSYINELQNQEIGPAALGRGWQHYNEE